MQNLFYLTIISLLFCLVIVAMEKGCLLLISFDRDSGTLRLRVPRGSSIVEEISRHLGKDFVQLEEFKKGSFVPIGPSELAVGKHIILIKEEGGSQPLKAIKGKLFDSSRLHIGSLQLLVGDDGVGRADEGTGLVTWDASVVLAAYLEKHSEHVVKGKRVLELGAGTGLTGIAAALLGADLVLLTDLSYTLNNLRRNVELHHSSLSNRSVVEVSELDWSRPETYDARDFDVVLAADVVWVEELIPAFVAALGAVACRKGSHQPLVLLGHQTRTKRSDELLFSLLAKEGFDVRRMPQDALHPQFSTTNIGIYECRATLPRGFCFLDERMGIRTWLRYATKENFVGSVVDGYAPDKHRAVITIAAAEALERVQDAVSRDGYDLVVYDAFRPQRAVDHFLRWSRDQTMDSALKAKYFPNIPDKSKMFELGFLALKSGHSRGSTVDLTLIRKTDKLVAPDEFTLFDGTIDMGSHFDFLGSESSFDSPSVSYEQMSMRRYLRSKMEEQGFKPLDDEWWHFTLRDEPFPDQYFDF